MADAHASSSADALLTEHFRYTPLSLIDDIINTVNTIVYRALSAIETGLLNTPPATLGFSIQQQHPDRQRQEQDVSEIARAEIEDGVHQLETLLEATVDRNFDKFEIYTLRNLLTVPDGLERWMRLAHSRDLVLPLPADAPTPASIEVLRQQLHESQQLSLALEAEQAASARLLAELKGLTTASSNAKGSKTENLPPLTNSENAATTVPAPASLAFLASHHTSTSITTTTTTNPPTTTPSSTPLTTTAAFTTSQLPALRSLLSNLRPHLQTLSNDNAHSQQARMVEQHTDWDAPREKRRVYVEEEARRAVRDLVAEGAMAVGGVGEDKMEGLEGVGVGMDSVGALEKVVGSGVLRQAKSEDEDEMMEEKVGEK